MQIPVPFRAVLFERVSSGRLDFRDQRTLVGETRIRVLPNLDIKTGAAWEFVNATDTVEYRAGIDWRFDCWSLSALYINRHNGESEFRFQVNLLGVGQVGTSARPF